MSTFLTLMYHNLADLPDGPHAVSFASFHDQIAWLKAEDFVIEGFDGLEQRLRSRQWPERYLVVTFDDGHASNLHAAEILRAAGARATFFLTKDFCQRRSDYLREREIRSLAELCQVGSHTVTHPYLARLAPDQIRLELADSKAWLEDVTGTEVTTFSAPNGSLNSLATRLALATGYTLLGTSVEWWNDPSRVAAERTVDRMGIRWGFSMETFTTILEQNTAFFIKRRIRSALLRIPKALLSPEQIRQLRKRRK